MALKFSVDQEANAAYVRLSNRPISRTVEVSDNVLIDLDEFGVAVGIEVLSLEARIPLNKLETQFHVHSSDIDHLRMVQPSVGAFMSVSSGSDGVSVPPSTVQLA